jgi:hypothetical protein
MSVKFAIDLEVERFEKGLRAFAAMLIGSEELKELMKPIGKEMVSEARSRAGSAFTGRSGKLFGSINFISTENGGVFTTRKNLNRSNTYYSLFIEKGADIKPRKKKYLVFKIDREWKKVESARLKPRPFMGPVFNEYWEGQGAKGYKMLADVLKKKAEDYLK